MAKRFTDPHKWQDPWFQDLNMPFKLLWLYLVDNCNHAGIWKVNKRVAEFHLGAPIEWEKVGPTFGSRILWHSEHYWFIPKYMTFQYGADLYQGRAVQSAVKSIKDNGFHELAIKHLGKSYVRVSEDLPKTPQTLKATATAKDVDVEVDVGDGTEGALDRTAAFEKAYAMYPRKIGRKAAYRHFLASVKSVQDVEDLMTALQNYKAYLTREKVESRYVKHADSWFNNWTDWIDVESEKKEIPSWQ